MCTAYLLLQARQAILKTMIPTSMVMLIPTTHCSVHLSRIPGKKVKDTLYLLIVATLCLAV